MKPLFRVLDEMRPDPWRLLLGALTGAAAVACSIALLGVSGWLITRAAQQPPILFLMVAIVAVRAFGIGRGVLRYCERLVSHDVALRGVVRLRETLFSRLATADESVAAGLKRGDLLARLGADVDELGDVVVRGLLPFVTAAITAAASVVALWIILPQAGIVLAVCTLIALTAVPYLAATGGRRDVVGTARTRTEMSENVLALVDNLPELTVAGRTAGQVDGIRRLDDELSRGLDSAARPASWAAGLGSAVMSAAVLGCLVVGTQAVADGRIREVALAVLAFVPLALAEVVAALPAAAVSLVKATEAARRVVPLLDTPAPTGEGRSLEVQARPVATNAYAHSEGLRMVRENPGVHLRAQDLSAGWPGREPAVSGVDLDLSAGRRVAIVGPSGQGKSTLLRTLAGLLPVAGGRMMMDGTDVGDGIDLADVHTRSVRHLVHLTADDAHVFGTTVRENLRVACKDATDDDLLAALRRAGLGEWVAGLTDGDATGLDVVVGDPAGPGQGAGTHLLSGGIRRRLLMARAFASGAPVLLVDEPAEHLDPGTADDLVAEVLDATREVETAVVVTHRVTPLALADEVLWIDEGRVVARGTHDELIKTYPPYRNAWAAERSESAVPA